MITAETSPLEKADLQVAFDSANEVYDALINKVRRSTEERIMFDLSAICMEAIDCMENNTVLDQSCFNRISCYVPEFEQHNLLKVAYSMTVLVEQLLAVRHDKLSKSFSEVSSSRIDAPSTSRGPHQRFPSNSRPPADGKEVKKEPDADEKAIKEEPIDDYEGDNQIKTEELEENGDVKPEPVADTFCPITGESRPVEPNVREYRGVKRSGTGRNETTVKRTDRRNPVTTMSFVRSTGMSQNRKCYLCNTCTDRYYQTPYNEPERSQFLSRIIIRSEIERTRINAAQMSGYRAVFCGAHVADIQMAVAPQKSLVFNRPMEIPQQRKSVQCDMCLNPVFPCKIASKDPLQALKFLDSLIFDTPDIEIKMRTFIRNPMQRSAIICQRHFKPPTERIIRATRARFIN